MSRPWQDEAILRDLYIERGWSTYTIAKELGCNQSTVWKWLDKNEIERRDRIEASRAADSGTPVRFETYSRGYERWDYQDNDDRRVVRVHRLLAVAEYGIDAVAGMDVHHRNGIPWDNRPSNIELLEHGEHTSLHESQRRRGPV